jgi:hypothetical protein
MEEGGVRKSNRGVSWIKVYICMQGNSTMDPFVMYVHIVISILSTYMLIKRSVSNSFLLSQAICHSRSTLTDRRAQSKVVMIHASSAWNHCRRKCSDANFSGI